MPSKIFNKIEGNWNSNLILKMLFLILNKVSISPYVNKFIEDVAIPETSQSDYEHYDEIYHEMMKSNHYENMFHVVGILASLIGIVYFTIGIFVSSHYYN